MAKRRRRRGRRGKISDSTPALVGTNGAGTSSAASVSSAGESVSESGGGDD